MSKFIIHCTTNWCGIWEDYAAIADTEEELEDTADQLSSDLFNSYDCWNDIAEEQGYDVDEMTELDWETLYGDTDEYAYRSWTIEEIDESDEDSMEDWESLELVYGPENNEATQDN